MPIESVPHPLSAGQKFCTFNAMNFLWPPWERGAELHYKLSTTSKVYLSPPGRLEKKFDLNVRNFWLRLYKRRCPFFQAKKCGKRSNILALGALTDRKTETERDIHTQKTNNIVSISKWSILNSYLI